MSGGLFELLHDPIISRVLITVISEILPGSVSPQARKVASPLLKKA